MKKIADGYLFSASDLSNFLACQHATSRDMRRAAGEIEIPFRHNDRLERLIEKGLAHESAYLESFKRQGFEIVELANFDDANQLEVTAESMRRGVDVIFQGSLASGVFAGRSDFLIRVDTASDLGDWSYEVVDTKLSQDTRAGTVLQLCLYSECVAAIQGRRPRVARVVKPSLHASDVESEIDAESEFEEEVFELDRYWAYFQLVKRQLLDATTDGRLHDVYPEPCNHCDICRWFPDCDQRRRADDHLSFVAGMQASQIDEVRRQGNNTLQSFAESNDPIPERPKVGSRDSILKAHRQATVQLRGRQSGTRVIEYLPRSVESANQRADDLGERFGFERLPEPDQGDVYLDFEGDPHVSDGVLEYLFGYVSLGDGEPEYCSDWCFDRVAERKAFEKLMQYLLKRRKDFPNFHIYHFAPYEPAAMKRMAMRHQLYEEELDEFLRAERFVDLHAVVRQSMILSVESYSLKQLEDFYGFDREADLRDARVALSQLEYAIEMNGASKVPVDVLSIVEAYNKEDCLSTKELHRWLELQRDTAQAEGGTEFSRPAMKSGGASERIAERNVAFAAVRDHLKAMAGDDRQSDIQHARWLMAHLLEYFTREEKTVHWEYFRHRDLEDDDLLFENAAIAGLELIEQRPPTGRERQPTSIYRYPQQDHTVRQGNRVSNCEERGLGKVTDIDHAARTIGVKKTERTIDVHPTAIFADDVIRAEPMPDALLELARELATVDWNPESTRSAQYDLLMRRNPRLHNLSLPREGEPLQIAIETALNMDQSVLPIQGPPGSGKTFVGGHMIVELARRGFKVGVTAVSHKVISNLLIRAATFDDAGVVSFAQKTKSIEQEGGERIQILASNSDAVGAVANHVVVGGTAWLWAREDVCGELDYLFIDEAGQMSLAQALAAARAAKNVILLGDPQQLEQPQQAAHPEGADAAVLGHLIGDSATIASEAGLFLDQTRRLHPDISVYTSEQFYDGRLASHPDCVGNEIGGKHRFAGSGLRLVSVEHENNQNRSNEEVVVIRSIVDELFSSSASWIGGDGIERTIQSDDILIVAAYNAQVDALAEAVEDRARVGTVDKFQGQEAPIVIYSTASSSAADAPRGLEFLFDPHRLNVATSRAKCLTVIVASPMLFRPQCQTPRQMVLANAFCRYAEFAATVTASRVPPHA